MFNNTNLKFEQIHMVEMLFEALSKFVMPQVLNYGNNLQENNIFYAEDMPLA